MHDDSAESEDDLGYLESAASKATKKSKMVQKRMPWKRQEVLVVNDCDFSVQSYKVLTPPTATQSVFSTREVASKYDLSDVLPTPSRPRTYNFAQVDFLPHRQ